MMKHRDLIFLAFPLSVLILVALAVGLLFHQFRAFEHAYIQDAQETLRQDAHFVAQVIDDDLRAGNLASIRSHFAFFTGKPLRFTLIAPGGDVVAESDAPLANLANHADRPEVQAIDADGDFETRYSTTMNAWLLYYAMPLHDGWVLRASLPTAALDAAIGQVRLAIILALCAGLILALALFLYLFLRVRPHFNALQASAVAIARGRLDTPIDVPRNGPLRELAKAIAVMGRQLRNRIDELRRERDDFDTLFNTLREPLLLVAPNGDILRSNRAAADLFGEAVATPGFRIERTACPELIAYVRGAFAEPTLHGREIPFDDGGTPRALLAHAVRMEREGKLCPHRPPPPRILPLRLRRQRLPRDQDPPRRHPLHRRDPHRSPPRRRRPQTLPRHPHPTGPPPQRPRPRHPLPRRHRAPPDRRRPRLHRDPPRLPRHRRPRPRPRRRRPRRRQAPHRPRPPPPPHRPRRRPPPRAIPRQPPLQRPPPLRLPHRHPRPQSRRRQRHPHRRRPRLRHRHRTPLPPLRTLLPRPPRPLPRKRRHRPRPRHRQTRRPPPPRRRRRPLHPRPRHRLHPPPPPPLTTLPTSTTGPGPNPGAILRPHALPRQPPKRKGWAR